MKKLIVLIIFAFLGVLFFAVNIGMTYDGESMTKCIFMGEGEMQCDMGLNEHLNAWEQFLVADWNFRLATFVLMFLVFVPTFALAFKKSDHYFFELSRFSAAKFFRQDEAFVRFFSPVFVSLYSGILQPKLYQKK